MPIESHLSPVFTASSMYCKIVKHPDSPSKNRCGVPPHGAIHAHMLISRPCRVKATLFPVSLHGMVFQHCPALSGCCACAATANHSQLDRAGPPCQNSLTNLSAGMVYVGKLQTIQIAFSTGAFQCIGQPRQEAVESKGCNPSV